MPLVDGVSANRHKYIIPGLIDADVVEEQSRKQATKYGESAVVHYHIQGEPCSDFDHSVHGEVRNAGKLRTKVNKPIA